MIYKKTPDNLVMSLILEEFWIHQHAYCHLYLNNFIGKIYLIIQLTTLKYFFLNVALMENVQSPFEGVCNGFLVCPTLAIINDADVRMMLMSE